MNSCTATNPTAPYPIIASCWLLETILAQIVCFFDTIERLIYPYATLIVIVSTVWSISQYGIINGTTFGIPLGLVMSLVYGIVIILAMFAIGISLWLVLIPLYFIAASCRWQLPSVLEQNPVVAKWIVGWDRGWQEQQSAMQLVAWLAIGGLLGCWLGE